MKKILSLDMFLCGNENVLCNRSPEGTLMIPETANDMFCYTNGNVLCHKFPEGTLMVPGMENVTNDPMIAFS